MSIFPCLKLPYNKRKKTNSVAWTIGMYNRIVVLRYYVLKDEIFWHFPIWVDKLPTFHREHVSLFSKSNIYRSVSLAAYSYIIQLNFQWTKVEKRKWGEIVAFNVSIMKSCISVFQFSYRGIIRLITNYHRCKRNHPSCTFE